MADRWYVAFCSSVLILAGCVDQVTGPERSEQATELVTPSAFLYSGETYVTAATVPSRNLPGYSGLWLTNWDTISTPPPPDTTALRVNRAWIWFDLTGTVEVSESPENAELCAGGHGSSCPPIYSGSYWGPRGRPTSGASDLHLQLGQGSYTFTPQLYSSTDSTVAFVYSSWNSSAPWMWRRKSLAGSDNCIGTECEYSWVAHYSLESNQQISARYLVPHSLEQPTAFPAAGDTVVFEALGGESATTITWRFRANDTLPNKAGWGGTTITACANKVVCKHVPTTPGRMYIQGNYGSQLGSAYSWSKATFPGRIPAAVACLPSPVTRGDNVTCTVSRLDGAVLDSTFSISWRFDPDSLIELLPDSLWDPGLSPVEFGPSTSSEWIGRAVHGGTVSVEVAALGFNTAQTTSELVVARRSGAAGTGASWDELLVTWDATPALFGGQLQPGIIPGLGNNVDEATGSNNPLHVLKGSASFLKVIGGPNAGYWFVNDQTLHADRGWQLNRQILQDGDSVWVDPFGTWRNHWQTLTAFGPASPQIVVDFVTGHEGYGHGGAKGHQGQIEVVAADLISCGNLPHYAEPIVGGTEIRLGEAYDVLKNAYERAMVVGSGHHYVWGNAADTASAPAADISWIVLPTDSTRTDYDIYPRYDGPDTTALGPSLIPRAGCLYTIF